MKIEILEKKGNTLKFKLADSSPAFANTIRRLLYEIPTMAIDEIIIIENSTPLYDEILAHRLGMIPLTTPVGVYNITSQCSCEGHGCSQCEVSLTLEKECTDPEGIETIYSKDLQSEDPEVKPVLENIPILRFTHDQKVVIQAIARLGKAIDHAKFQSAIASYKYEPLIEIDEEKAAFSEEIVDLCPAKVFKFDKTLKVIDKNKCTLCMNCVENSPEPGAVKITTTGKDFLFTLTSLGQMSPESLLKQALELLKERASELINKIEELTIET